MDANQIYTFTISQNSEVPQTKQGVSNFQKGFPTVDGWNLANHLGWCWNPINNGINYQHQLVSLPDFSHQQYLLRFGDGELSLWHHPCHHRFRGQAKPGSFLRDFFWKPETWIQRTRNLDPKNLASELGKAFDFAWHWIFFNHKKKVPLKTDFCFFSWNNFWCVAGRWPGLFFCCGRVQLPMGAGEAGRLSWGHDVAFFFRADRLID